MRDQALVFVPLDPPGYGLRVVGDLDMATVAEFESALAELAPDRQVTLDFSELAFVDSAGIHAIIEYARSRNGGAPLILANPSKIALRTFEIVGLPVLPTIEIRGTDGG